MRILVVNAGSSSLKLALLDGLQRLEELTVASPGGQMDLVGLQDFVRAAGPLDAVGHRIVHGGTEFTGPVRIDPAVRQRLEEFTALAPLHQPKSLAALDAVSTLLPDVPAVACFDTAFHTSIPPEAATYALPEEWRRRWPLRRYGFHGLSHAFMARRASEITRQPIDSLRTVSCHLGAGASVTAICHGRSVDTTMGFTPLEGLVMATRSGSVDPGLVLWLEEHAGVPAAELLASLEHRSGLLGLAGSADLRVVLDGESAGDRRCILAIGVYLHHLRSAIASMAASMNGLDVLVFTGGAGEHSPPIRLRTGVALAFLGIDIDASLNSDAQGDTQISPPGAAVTALVVQAREDLQIAGEVRSLLG